LGGNRLELETKAGRTEARTLLSVFAEKGRVVRNLGPCRKTGLLVLSAAVLVHLAGTARALIVWIRVSHIATSSAGLS
jgi:hypothetical protein